MDQRKKKAISLRAMKSLQLASLHFLSSCNLFVQATCDILSALEHESASEDGSSENESLSNFTFSGQQRRSSRIASQKPVNYSFEDDEETPIPPRKKQEKYST